MAKHKFISVTYDLYVGGENEELMEQATKDQPLTFISWIGMMLPKFEENVANLNVGDKFDFVINHEDAYGEYDTDSVLELDKKIFEIDGKFDAEVIKEGNVVPLMNDEGYRFNASVVEVSADKVKVDLNHPLAGEDLHFKGEVIESREATKEEVEAAKNPHKCGGCGGNCSGNCSGNCGEGDCNCEGGCEGCK